MRTEQPVNLRASLDTVIIFTTRMEEMAAFYQEGLDIGPYEISPNHLGCRVGPIYFGFDQVEDAKQGDSNVTLWFEVDDIQGAFDRLLAMGARERYPPSRKPWGATLAAVYDPDGNMIGLSQRSASRD